MLMGKFIRYFDFPFAMKRYCSDLALFLGLLISLSTSLSLPLKTQEILHFADEHGLYATAMRSTIEAF